MSKVDVASGICKQLFVDECEGSLVASSADRILDSLFSRGLLRLDGNGVFKIHDLFAARLRQRFSLGNEDCQKWNLRIVASYFKSAKEGVVPVDDFYYWTHFPIHLNQVLDLSAECRAELVAQWRREAGVMPRISQAKVARSKALLVRDYLASFHNASPA
jgi:hypothetical protein